MVSSRDETYSLRFLRHSIAACRFFSRLVLFPRFGGSSSLRSSESSLILRRFMPERTEGGF